MFLTVTPNPALDQNIFIDAWAAGVPTHARTQVNSVGGKGLDASVALRHLGQATVGLHFAAGQTGRALLRLLEQYGVVPAPVWVDGETRTALIIVETQAQRHTHIFTGDLVVAPSHRETFLARYRDLLASARWVLAGGILPPDAPLTFYRTLVEMACARSVPILVDAARAPVLECLSAQPSIVKMNRDEFDATFGGAARAMAHRRAGDHVRRGRNFRVH